MGGSVCGFRLDFGFGSRFQVWFGVKFQDLGLGVSGLGLRFGCKSGLVFWVQIRVLGLGLG